MYRFAGWHVVVRVAFVEGGIRLLIPPFSFDPDQVSSGRLLAR